MEVLLADHARREPPSKDVLRRDGQATHRPIRVPFMPRGTEEKQERTEHENQQQQEDESSEEPREDV
jgi:hypothetical protein